MTAEQVVSKYMDAIGASRFSSITTLKESGELYGNVTNFWQGYRSPWQSQSNQQGTFESYFKSPNLRFYSSLTDKNQIVALYGCDGKVAWSIDSYLKLTESKRKPKEGECQEGFQVPLSYLRKPDAKMRLLGKRDLDGRGSWAIRVNFPKSASTQTYYFDAETFLLLRFEGQGTTVAYSDYRDLGGIKLPFRTNQEFSNSKLVTTVREIKINADIDDARFAEPQVRDGKVSQKPFATAKKDATETANNVSTPRARDIAVPDIPPSGEVDTRGAVSMTEVNFPNFTSCTISELQLTVPELKGLNPSPDQEKLAVVLEKVGAKTLDIARNTPNLIARERVTEAAEGTRESKRDYDYLILARIQGKMVGLDEFRLDLKSGEKFQTDEIMNKGSSFRSDLERASNEVATSKNGRPPLSQGFATAWVHFYPSNQARATYRYLGEQKRDGHRTLVLAFAQKPASTLLPAVFQYQGKTASMFLQGIAWVDASDFRILRLRTDLLSPVPEVSLQRLTADIQFGLTRIEKVPSPLPLPRQVAITATVNGSTTKEIHEYSEYRLFRAQSKVVPLP